MIKIKFEVRRDFDGEKSITPCPYRDDGVTVESRICGRCNFYHRRLFFSNAIKCEADSSKERTN